MPEGAFNVLAAADGYVGEAFDDARVAAELVAVVATSAEPGVVEAELAPIGGGGGDPPGDDDPDAGPPADGDVEPTNVTFAYDGDGNRLSKTSEDGTTSYVWDQAASLPVLALEEGPAGDRRYVYGLDLISASTETHGEVYFHEDGSGSTTALTDDAGELLRTYRYHPFGAVIDGTAVAGAPRIDQLYNGQYRDRETGLYHLRARYYDPGLARFTQADPLPAVHGAPFVSAYAYANNAPLTMADPSGMRAAEIEYLRQAAEASYSFFDKLRAGDFAAMDLDDIQEGVGYLGIIPGIGDALDVVNGIVYLARGKYLEASLSLLAVVPVVGSAGTVGRSVARHADEAADAGRLLRRGGDEVMEGLSAGSRTFDGFSAGVARGGADFPNPGRLADPTADVGRASDSLNQAAQSASRATNDSVFRVLRPDENPTDGLVAKNPVGDWTPEGAVLNGSRPSAANHNQWIHATTERAVAEEWAQRTGGRIAEIDLSRVPSQVIDLSTETGRAAHLQGVTARNFAAASSEILIESHVPAAAIVRVW